MSGALAQAMKTAAHQVATAVEDGVRKSVTNLYHSTGDNLQKNVTAHIEHDSKAATDLETAAKRHIDIHHPHGGNSPTARSIGSTGSPGVVAVRTRAEIEMHPAAPQPNVPLGLVDPSYKPLGDLTQEEFSATHTIIGEVKYPPDHGTYPEKELRDPPQGAGTRLDRFGYPGGHYVSPGGTTFSERSLPPGTLGKAYHVYEVTGEPLPPNRHIYQGPVAPAFEQPGGGQQFRVVGIDPKTGEEFDASIQDLLDSGYLREIRP